MPWKEQLCPDRFWRQYYHYALEQQFWRHYYHYALERKAVA